jgi:antitoxin component YwqK of YwqJK toxin-antitoxin module
MSVKNYNIDGKYNDTFEEYHENGQCFRRGTYLNGKKH